MCSWWGMTIVFENGKMIITHDTGLVDIYDKTHLLKVRESVRKSIEQRNENLVLMDSYIAQLDASVKPIK